MARPLGLHAAAREALVLLQLGNPFRQDAGRFGSSGDSPSLRVTGRGGLAVTDAHKATAAAIVKGLPSTWKGSVTVEPGYAGRKTELFRLKIRVPGAVIAENGAGGFISVEVGLLKDSVVMEEVRIPAEVQGEGAGKAILRNVVALAQERGAKTVELTAGAEVGAYAWARMGFTAVDPKELAWGLWNRLGYTSPAKREDFLDEEGGGLFTKLTPVKLSKAETKAIDLVIKKYKNDPTLPWRVADLRVGKENVGRKLLTNASTDIGEWAIEWDGVLDLSNKAAMARFTHYTGKK